MARSGSPSGTEVSRGTDPSLRGCLLASALTMKRGPWSPPQAGNAVLVLPVEILVPVQISAQPKQLMCSSSRRGSLLPGPSGTFCLHPIATCSLCTTASGARLSHVCPPSRAGLWPPPPGAAWEVEGHVLGWGWHGEGAPGRMGCPLGTKLTSHTCPPHTSFHRGSPAKTGSCSPGSSE